MPKGVPVCGCFDTDSQQILSDGTRGNLRAISILEGDRSPPDGGPQNFSKGLNENG